MATNHPDIKLGEDEQLAEELATWLLSQGMTLSDVVIEPGEKSGEFKVYFKVPLDFEAFTHGVFKPEGATEH